MNVIAEDGEVNDARVESLSSLREDALEDIERTLTAQVPNALDDSNRHVHGMRVGKPLARAMGHSATRAYALSTSSLAQTSVHARQEKHSACRSNFTGNSKIALSQDSWTLSEGH